MSGFIWKRSSREDQNTKLSHIDQTHITYGKEWFAGDPKDILHFLSIKIKQVKKMMVMLEQHSITYFNTQLSYVELRKERNLFGELLDIQHFLLAVDCFHSLAVAFDL